MPLITDSVGRVLGKRYRLVAALGTGASAHVFLAEDVSLGRRVAVKVLQPALAKDEAFLKRFRAEARSVASLSHPNVLGVFDWGEDSDGPYLVTEYLGGGSLRDLLDRSYHLSHSQAARLGSQAASGLAYAHARGLVHRDVKPANLLFDEDGRVRVADFGVARALAEAAWTEPSGAMVGTARYASPEQAEGRGVDGRADVYSLALVIYEAVTGVVPFVTDTTMGTLMARVGATLPHHEGLGPLDDVLARAAAPDPSTRLDAAGLTARLDALGSALPTPTPLPLQLTKPKLAPGSRSPDAERRISQSDLTAVVPLEKGASGEGTASVDVEPRDATRAIKAQPGEVFDAEALGATASGGDDATGNDASEGVDGSAPTPPRIARRRRRRWPWLIGIVVLAAALGAAVLVAVREKVFVPSRPVPALIGDTVGKARSQLEKEHLQLSVGPPTFSITVVSGHIVSQVPSPRAMLKEGQAVKVVVSKGPPPVRIPSLAGVSCTGAQSLLTAAHLIGVCAPGAAAYSQSVPTGQVINWSYNNILNATSAPYGSTIQIAISKGKPPVVIPNGLAGESYAAAKAALQNLGLGVSQSSQYSTKVPAGQVIGTTPAAGQQAPAGSTVTVVVSAGPPMVTIPALGGDSVAQATAALQALGLTVANVYGPANGTVFDSVPASGATVAVGSSVNIYTQ